MSESKDLSRLPLSQSRVRIVELLQLHYANGNLEMEEFESRLDLANNAQSVEDLMPLIKDLPAVAGAAQEAADSPVQINRGAVKPNRTILTFLSGNTRKGVWKPPRNLNVVTFMGGAELDFREAVMAPDTTTINIFCLMGGVDITVPPGLHVETQGFAFMGGFEDHADEPLQERGPKLVVRGFAMMGGVEIKTKEKKKR